MRPSAAKLLLIALSLVVPTSALASTWYADGKNGDDVNDCKSPATACGSIGHAIALSAPGDTVEIAAATYQDNLTIPFDLTLNGAKATTTIIDGGYNADVVVALGTTANVVLSNLTIQKGSGSHGGGVLNGGLMTITNSVITGNVAGAGGGIYNSGTLTISSSTITGNYAAGTYSVAGGGIYNYLGTLTINNSTLSKNAGTPAFVYGGAILNNGGTVAITNSTFTANTANGSTGGGGGAIDTGGGTVIITNSTFSGNTAAAVFGGGALYIEGGTVEISNSTFNKNTSLVPGGGISVVSGTVTLQNSIVAGSGKSGNCSGAVASSGYNLSSDLTCHFRNTGDRNKTNPKLGPLKSNGGPTQTSALKTGSPAIDAGNPGGCTDNSGQLLTADQRGMPRPDNGETGCDMGAYESQTP
jgi:fibronectin-binding autotransporter adhesin